LHVNLKKGKLYFAVLVSLVLVIMALSPIVNGSSSLLKDNYKLSSAHFSMSEVNNTSHTIGGNLTVIPSPSTAFSDYFNPFGLFYPPVVDLIYEPLYQINYITGTYTPWLATGYNLTDSGHILTVNLRHNVTFSNGMPFNSTDVVFTFKTLDNLAIDYYGIWNYVDNVTSNGPYQVQFNFSTPDTSILYYILGDTYIVPEPLWMNVNASSISSYADTNPIGTGPYTLTSFSTLKMVFTRNPNYWQPGKPYLQKITYIDYSTTTTATEALAAGDAQWANIVSPGLNTTFVSKNPEFNHYYLPPSTPYFILTNDLVGPTNSSVFREALSIAINRTAIYQQAEYGYEPPASAMIIKNQESKWLNSTTQAEMNTSTDFNTTKALNLLESNGYKMSSGGQLEYPNGTLIPSLGLLTIGSMSDWVAAAAIMSTDLFKIGLTVNVEPLSFGTLIEKATDGQFQLAMDLTGLVGPTPLNVLSMYDDYNETYFGIPLNEMYWNSSIGGWIDDYNAAVHSNNFTVQDRYVNEMYSILAQQMPVIPVNYNVLDDEWINSTIQGWPTQSNYYAIGAPNVEPNSEVVLVNLYYSPAHVTTTSKPTPLPGYVIPLVSGIIVIIIVAAVAGVLISRRSNVKK
jgi:peptide/nickel transport system substrate-binding protein